MRIVSNNFVRVYENANVGDVTQILVKEKAAEGYVMQKNSNKFFTLGGVLNANLHIILLNTM